MGWHRLVVNLPDWWLIYHPTEEFAHQIGSSPHTYIGETSPKNLPKDLQKSPLLCPEFLLW